MNLNINKTDIEKLIDYHGLEYTDWVIAEELAELIQAYSKIKRHGCEELSEYLNELKTEIIDVYIVLEMIKIMHNISDTDIQQGIAVKMEQNLERCKNGTEFGKM